MILCFYCFTIFPRCNSPRSVASRSTSENCAALFKLFVLNSPFVAIETRVKCVFPCSILELLFYCSSKVRCGKNVKKAFVQCVSVTMVVSRGAAGFASVGHADCSEGSAVLAVKKWR